MHTRSLSLPFFFFFFLISFCSYSAKGKIQSELSLCTKYKRFAGVPCCAGKKHQLIDPPCHFTFSQDFTALNVFVCKDPKAGVNMIEVLHWKRKSNVSFKGKRCVCGRSSSWIHRCHFWIENILAFCDFGDLGARGFECLPLSFL